MIDYSLHPCKACNQPSVGFFSDLKSPNEYYCNRHWYARKTREDKIQDAQEFEQWKDQAWYQEAYPEKFGDPFNSLSDRLAKKRKDRESNQISLFTL